MAQPQTQNPLEKTFKNPQYPASMLTEDNVLAYFSDHSNPFYQRNCDNETLRMQNLSSNNVMLHEALT